MCAADDGNTSAVLQRLGLPVGHLGNVMSLYVVPNVHGSFHLKFPSGYTPRARDGRAERAPSTPTLPPLAVQIMSSSSENLVSFHEFFQFKKKLNRSYLEPGQRI